MTRATDTVSKAFGAVRRGAARAGQAGAEATVRAAHIAEQKLTERGIAPTQLRDALTESAELAREEVVRTSRRTRKKLARKAKQTRKELAKAATAARKAAGKPQSRKAAKRAGKKLVREAKQSAKQLRANAKGRRRWPLLVGLMAIVGGAIAVVMKNKSAAGTDQLPAPRKDQSAAKATEDTQIQANARRNGQTTARKPAPQRSK